jgi:hypothetical protein
MNARTLIITAGALVALAAPAVASAKLSPASQYQKNLAAKKHAAKHAKQVLKRQGQSRQIYTYYPAPAYQGEESLQEIEAGYNLDLIAHGLDPVQFPDTGTASATSADTSTASATSDDSSSTPASDAASSTSTSDSTPAADASLAAAPATSIAAVDDSDDC